MPSDLWFNLLSKSIRNRLDILLRYTLQEIYRCSNGATGKTSGKEQTALNLNARELMKWVRQMAVRIPPNLSENKFGEKQHLGSLSNVRVTDQKQKIEKSTSRSAHTEVTLPSGFNFTLRRGGESKSLHLFGKAWVEMDAVRAASRLSSGPKNLAHSGYSNLSNE